MLQAIETRYNGYRFRSRLEARWAVHFGMHGLEYEFEKEGFDLGRFGWYLPDFWLPDPQWWIEIKGKYDPSDPNFDKMAALVMASQHPLFCFMGNIGPDVKGVGFLPTGDRGTFGMVDTTWVVCPACMSLALLLWWKPQTGAELWCSWVDCRKKRRLVFNPGQLKRFLEESLPSIERSYEPARAARFEHGERG